MNIHHLLEQFYNWVSSYPPNTILLIIAIILFIATVVESLPFVGILFPSESLTVFFGILAFKGIVDIYALIFIAFIGLFIGDEIGYKIGQKFDEDFIKKNSKKLRINEEKYESIKSSLDNNLFKILLIGRSNGFTRWLIPFIAGSNNIDYKKFTIANLATAAFWSPAFLLGGYFLGNMFEQYGKYLGIGILIATIVSFVFYKTYKYLDNKGYLKRNDFKLLIINLTGLYIFSKMLEDVIDLEYIVKLDMLIHDNISQIYSTFLTKLMIIITSVDNIIPITIITLSIVIYLYYKKYYNEMLFLFISVTGASFLMVIIKSIIERPRPELKVIEVVGYSFPSGHATISTALGFTIFYILKDKIKYRKSFLMLCIIIPLLISFSRIYLNVHYLSDVLAGISLALFWVSLIAIIFDLKRKKFEAKV